MELTDDIYCVLDEHFNVIECGTKWSEVLGLSQSESIGMSFLDLWQMRNLTPQDIRARLSIFLNEPIGQLPSLKFVAKDYAVKIIRWKFKWTNDQVHLIGQDETELTKTKDVLDIIENQLKVGYWRLNLIDMKPWWSEQTIKIHELPKDTNPTLQDAINHYAPEAMATINEAVQNCLATGKRYDLEVPFVTAKGKKLWVRTTGQAIFDKGQAVELFGIFEDISERKRLEFETSALKELTYQNERLASIGELASGVGHEINNPLAIAIGNIDFIKRQLIVQGSLSPDLTKHFERFERATNRITEIIGSLRSLARESGTNRYEELNINEIVKNSLSLVTEIYSKQYGIEIEFDLADHLNRVMANHGRICHVLTNLLSNAKEAVRNQNIKKITIKTQMKNETVLISIKDNGAGIPTQMRSKIFDPFFSTKSDVHGSGIGLTVSANIILEHGGRIYVNPDSEQTEFCIEIPAVKETEFAASA